MPATPKPPLPDAPAVERLGYALRLRRQAMPGIRNREQLAERIGYSVGVVKAVENGVYKAGLHRYMTRWEQVFGLDPELQELWQQTQTGVQAAPEERLGHALRHPTKVDLVTVATLRQQIQDLDVRYEHEPSTVLIADAGQCLSQLRFLESQAVSSRVRRELSAAAVEAATLMGQLVWDASQRRDNATPRAYFDDAVRAARQLRNPAAEGLALLRKTIVALYGQRDPRTGLRLAEQTATTTGGTSHVLTGLAVLHAAEAHAMLGQRQSCEQALSEAETWFSRVEATDTAAELFAPTQLGRLAGSCYLVLHDAKRAERVLTTTATAFQRPSKPQAIVLGNLALAYIGQGKVDDAVAQLHRAIDVVEQTWSGGGLNVAFGAGGKLRPWRHLPAVQEVSDRLLSLIAA